MDDRRGRKIFVDGVIIVTLLCLVAESGAQGTRSDYERALKLRETTANKVYKDRVTPHWLEGNTRFWYRNDLADGAREFVLVDAQAGTRQPAFDHERLAVGLVQAADQQVQADRLAIDRLIYDESESTLTFTFDGKWWLCDLGSYEVEATTRDERATTSLRPFRWSRRQGQRTGEETAITFINRTQNDVEIYWLESGRQRRHYTTLAAGAQHRQHTFGGHLWLVTDSDGEPLVTFRAEDQPADAIIDKETIEEAARRRGSRGRRDRRPQGNSPDGKWTALIKDHNLYIRNAESEEEIALTDDGTEEDAYSERFYWSPDSAKLAVLRVHDGFDRKVHLIESAPDDQLQPKLHSLDYRKPGDAIPIAKPHLFHLAEKRHAAIDDELFPNPWSISEIRWSPDSSRFTFLYNQRGHQVLRLVSVDADTGQARTLIDECSETFVDYAHKEFTHYVEDANEIIWMSERDGWNHLYLYDAITGCVKNQITKGSWVVRGVESVDDDKRQIWFRAGGIRPEQDPYYVHLCRVNFDGTGLVVLTEGDGTHDVTFSPDRCYLIDRWSRVDLPPVTELRSAEDGHLICELERAEWTDLLAIGWRAPERFVAKARDGKTDIYGIVIRPSNFDPQRTYPVIEQIYAGPQGAFVPKSFGLQAKQHAIAELGFIVVQMDGMGTSYRSKAFHDVCARNLGDSGFPDRILWMQAAAKKYPYMDLTRVGIYGGSAGGQSTLRGLLAHGDFYKVGVADCGCHDNRMDKIWWNELWMGWPLGPHYEEQSNVTQAHKLHGKLLLTVGELDRNVDPASTMQVVDALIKADKDFDFLIVPGAGHGVGETPYASRRRMDFFVRHLLGVEPRGMP
ncbi:MAG: DPP IV N-terminal domain-containing protein [Phycisphaerales bacterium]|nr:MAG: DPP IV N-terminal domain-containing protein [Phycisphaerales bacterium]